MELVGTTILCDVAYSCLIGGYVTHMSLWTMRHWAMSRWANDRAKSGARVRFRHFLFGSHHEIIRLIANRIATPFWLP